MNLHSIQLGNRDRTATGWLVSSGGAVRAVLTPYDAEVVLCFACDERVCPPDGFKHFRNINEARRWLGRRLEPKGSKGVVSADPSPQRLDLVSDVDQIRTGVPSAKWLLRRDPEAEVTEYVVLCDARKRRHAFRAQAIIVISEAECGCELVMADGQVLSLDCTFDNALSWLS